MLLSVVLVSVFVNNGRASENQRLFNNAVIRVQHLHQLAAKMINDFVRFPLIKIEIFLEILNFSSQGPDCYFGFYFIDIVIKFSLLSNYI